jgi:hypothetical protein
MMLIIEHQQEVVNNALIRFDEAIDRATEDFLESGILDINEAQEALKKWLKESKALDMLEDLNLKGVK